MQYTCRIVCLTCQKEIFAHTATSEQEAKEDFAKAITLSETHDCKAAPKKA